LKIDSGDPAHAESGFLEIVGDDFPVLHAGRLLIVQNRFRRRFAHFKLCVHFLQARGKRFNLLLLARIVASCFAALDLSSCTVRCSFKNSLSNIAFTAS
jgi:hypothetical protein